MGYYLKAGDVINGQQATVMVTTYDEQGNQQTVADCFEVKNIKATVTINNIEVNTLSAPGVQHKQKGWSGSGTAECYYASSRWNEIALKYIKNAKTYTFTMVITNADVSSKIGTQSIQLKDCKISELDIAAADVDADFLTHTLNFTFDDADMLEEFTTPAYLA
jgi:hypothetical protein